MYANPVFLPQFSNREDFLLTVSLFDDDTGDALTLSGCTGNGTFASWKVTAGAISTVSVTSLTISAAGAAADANTAPNGTVSLTVGTGLAIAQGDPVLIADAATGANQMVGYVTSYASSTGALVCQIGLTFQFEIRLVGPRSMGTGYLDWYDWGTTSDNVADGPVLTASLGNGITITDVGNLKIRLPESQVRTLCNGTYGAALTLTDSVDTRQVFIAKLPLFNGGVTN